MKKELNINNSKKIIIGVSVLFCTVILIIGGSLAFFTQSDSKELGNIVSSNDNNTYINYYDDKSMMFDNLIPIKSTDINKALYSNNICKDNNGYNVCSGYIFSLENTYGEVQKINISMIPTANSFTNLKYLVFKINDLSIGDVEVITENPLSLEKNNLNPITLIENKALYYGQDNIVTYAIVFYVESMNYNQTKEDAGKHFGASIRVDSLTTGKYIIKQFGDSCWDLELLDDKIDEYKLTKFYGINDDGSLKEECENKYVTQDTDGYYSINVPSSVGGQRITTLGYNLFTGGVFDSVDKMKSYNNYSKIKQIIIEEGITTIEDFKYDSESFNFIETTFMAVGSKLENDTYLNVKFPNSLLYIGVGSFYNANIRELKIPSSVLKIDNLAFIHNKNLLSLIFELDENGNSNLKTIGDTAFYHCNLTYPEGSPLVIPPSVKTIGYAPFAGNPNLKQLKFTGDASGFDSEWNNGVPVITE